MKVRGLRGSKYGNGEIIEGVLTTGLSVYSISG
jgi:hypothetical protein